MGVAQPLGLSEGGLEVDMEVVLLIAGIGVEDALVDGLGLVELLGAVGDLGGDVAVALLLDADALKGEGGGVEVARLVEGIGLLEGARGVDADAALGYDAEGVLEAVELEQGDDAGVLRRLVELVELDGGRGRPESLLVVGNGGGAQQRAERGGGILGRHGYGCGYCYCLR